jgi:hypothetical protein
MFNTTNDQVLKSIFFKLPQLGRYTDRSKKCILFPLLWIDSGPKDRMIKIGCGINKATRPLDASLGDVSITFDKNMG